MPRPQTRDGGRRIVAAHDIAPYLNKVRYWNELGRDDAEEMDRKVVPYSFRNSLKHAHTSSGYPLWRGL